MYANSTVQIDTGIDPTGRVVSRPPPVMPPVTPNVVTEINNKVKPKPPIEVPENPPTSEKEKESFWKRNCVIS